MCRLIFGHYVGESWSVRPVESRIFKVVLYLCSPPSDHLIFHFRPATSEGPTHSLFFSSLLAQN